MTADWPIRFMKSFSLLFFLTFAEASPATSAWHYLEKSCKWLASKDNPRQVWKSSEILSLYSLLSG